MQPRRRRERVGRPLRLHLWARGGPHPGPAPQRGGHWQGAAKLWRAGVPHPGHG